MGRPFAIIAALLLSSTGAVAQGPAVDAGEVDPDAEFESFPSAPPEEVDAGVPPPLPSSEGELTPPPPLPEPPIAAEPPARRPLPPGPAPAPPQVVQLPPREFNHVSIYGAPTLGQWRRGFGAYLGFPLLGIKAGIGVLDRLDVGVGFDSFYGVMNEARAFVKLNLFQDKSWAISAQLEGGAAFFVQSPEVEGNGGGRGARWLTGRRNFNIEPGLIFSYRGETPQSSRLFLDLRYHAALDTQPFAKDPLGGVPPSVVVGHNVPVRMGAEMPFTPTTSFLFSFGFDIHGRAPLDSAFMPVAYVGLVSGF